MRRFDFDSMKPFLRCCWLLVCLRLLTLHAHAGYSSLYIFGDSLSAVAGGGFGYPPPPGTTPADYYEGRFSNGRVWVEYLAQEQGIPFNTNDDFSAFGEFSLLALDTIIYGNFYPPPDIGTSLFVVWPENSDLFLYATFGGTNASSWSFDINNSAQNISAIIDQLYADGARTLLMPNAVDISRAPWFTYTITNSTSVTNNVGPLITAVHNGVVQLNAALATVISQARARHPDLTIFAPDFYTEFNKILEDPSRYGFTKTDVDALEDPALKDKTFDGPGANYVFWDYLHPTTRLHSFVANYVQQSIAPLGIARFNQEGASDRFDLINLPIGRTGTLECNTNLANPNGWTTRATITAKTATQTILISTNSLGSPCFFRLKYPE